MIKSKEAEYLSLIVLLAQAWRDDHSLIMNRVPIEHRISEYKMIQGSNTHLNLKRIAEMEADTKLAAKAIMSILSSDEAES